MKFDRRRALVRLLHEGGATSQQEIVHALEAAGHDVTQATVSRDLRRIGAVKVRSESGYAYKLPDEVPQSASADLMARSLTRTLGEFAIDLRPASSLLVVKTAPGHAAAVARAIDLAGLPEVLGSVAGDDTIFVATPAPEIAAALGDKWLEEMAGEQVLAGEEAR